MARKSISESVLHTDAGDFVIRKGKKTPNYRPEDVGFRNLNYRGLNTVSDAYGVMLSNSPSRGPELGDIVMSENHRSVGTSTPATGGQLTEDLLRRYYREATQQIYGSGVEVSEATAVSNTPLRGTISTTVNAGVDWFHLEEAATDIPLDND